MRTPLVVSLLLVAACAPAAPEDSPAFAALGDDAKADAPGGPQSPTGPFAVQGGYPIVLHHGFNASPDSEWGWNGRVKAVLEALGHKVFISQVNPYQAPEVRAPELEAFITDVLAQTGAQKVHLIAHSQGGLDARWAAAHAPTEIAAIVTIGTPHRGSKVADVALGLTPGPAQAAASSVLGLLGGEADVGAALQTLSTAGAAAFNAAVPDAAGVAYFSIAGRSNLRGAATCPPSAAPFVAAWDAHNDPLDALLWSTGGILTAAELPGTPAHDGLVTVPSAQWGTFLGCIPADHANEICQPTTGPGPGNGFDCLAFYRGLERWLRDQGL